MVAIRHAAWVKLRLIEAFFGGNVVERNSYGKSRMNRCLGKNAIIFVLFLTACEPLAPAQPLSPEEAQYRRDEAMCEAEAMKLFQVTATDPTTQLMQNLNVQADRLGYIQTCLRAKGYGV